MGEPNGINLIPPPPVFLPDRGRLHPRAIPPIVLELAMTLRRAGGQAWLVGGAVRDLLLARPVHDWDIATDLVPEVVSKLFPRSLEVGLRFGTVAVMRENVPYQITTFRRDGEYSDARRPDEVRFSSNLEEDLIRRDFTINALAYDPVDDRLDDPVGGEADLAAGLIRAVGRAEERFTEDGLRLLRAVRFSAQLCFRIEERTYRALVLLAPQVEKISKERIRDEFDRLVVAPGAAAALDLLHETGLLRRVLPELDRTAGVTQNRFHAYDIFHHTLAALQAASPERLLRLAVLFHDLGKVDTRAERKGRTTFYNHQSISARLADTAMRRLRYANEEREMVVHLVRLHMFHYRPEWTDAAVRRFLRDIGRDHLSDLFALRAADTSGNGLRHRLAPELQELRQRIERELERESALNVRDLKINGHDLMQSLGLTPGPEVGRLLHGLLEEVIEDPSLNERDGLLRRARELHQPTDPPLPGA